MAADVFSLEHISDEKRLIRAEQWVYARSILRARDGVHHRNWSVMMLAGGAPHGEISAIRAVMPQAHITAVDADARCCEAARLAGADQVLHGDLAAFTEHISEENRGPLGIMRSAKFIEDHVFDVIHLDICGAVTSAQDLVRVYKRQVAKGGVLIVTFSYGRDVVEVFRDILETCNESEKKSYWIHPFRAANVPDIMIGRLIYVVHPSGLRGVRQVCLYRGSEMPMCSVLLTPRKDRRAGILPKFIKAGPGDYELSVVYPDVSALYDCPTDRIMALRRKFPAIKAWYSLQKKRERAARVEAPLFELSTETDRDIRVDRRLVKNGRIG